MIPGSLPKQAVHVLHVRHQQPVLLLTHRREVRDLSARFSAHLLSRFRSKDYAATFLFVPRYVHVCSRALKENDNCLQHAMQVQVGNRFGKEFRRRPMSSCVKELIAL